MKPDIDVALFTFLGSKKNSWVDGFGPDRAPPELQRHSRHMCAILFPQASKLTAAQTTAVTKLILGVTSGSLFPNQKKKG